MPGLIKLGKTTTHPSQRMAELHSTGVPTPFTLELSATVTDCHFSERAAHTALAKFRVSGNREFFRISVAKAFETILPVIGPYEIDDVRETHGIRKIEQVVAQRERAKVAAEEARQAAQRLTAQTRESERLAKRRDVEEKIRAEERKLERLGARPTKKENSGLIDILGLCYFPLPLGWIFWLGAMNIFGSKRETAGWVCVALLVAGYFAWTTSRERDAEFEAVNEPFQKIDNQIYSLKEDLRKIG